MTAPEMLALMVAAHMLADYPLQGEFLARGKNRTDPLPGVPWQHAMAAHCSIHGGLVGLITGSIWLGLAEVIAHWLTDDAKCRGKITYHQDQAIHLGCKAAWAAIWGLST